MAQDGASLINLARYPIHQIGPEYDAVLARVREDLGRDGCAVLKGFLTEDGIAALTQEAESVAEMGHRSFNRTNPYFTKDDPSLPPDDPRRPYSQSHPPTDRRSDRNFLAPNTRE